MQLSLVCCLVVPKHAYLWKISFDSSDAWSVCCLIPFLFLFQEDQAKPGQPGQAPRPVGAGNPTRA